MRHPKNASEVWSRACRSGVQTPPSAPGSLAAKVARENLHLDGVRVKNVSEDSAALAEMEKLSGGGQAPCLVVEGQAVLESGEIIARLAKAVAPL